MRLVVAAVVLAAPLLLSSPSWAEGQYAPGVTNTEIKIGNTMPYSGPASAVGVSGRAMAAYFAMINEHGGVNGRNITFISLDDAYSPPKTVEQTRRLVEQEGVAFMFAPLGTPTNSAIQGYLNEKRVPQLFLGSNASKWNQPSDPSRRGTSPRASPATGRPRGQGCFFFGACAGAVMENETIAVRGENERDIQGLGIFESLLHPIADTVCVVLRLNQRQRNIGLVVEDVVSTIS
jgi:Periplasmic binding protein